MVKNEGNGNGIPDRVIRVELISFFNRFPATVGSSGELARLLGRNSEQVERQLDDLVQLRILEKVGENGHRFYRYVPAISVSLAGNGLGEKLPWSSRSPWQGGDRPIGDAAWRKKEVDREGQARARLKLTTSALKAEDWKECIGLLLDAIYRVEVVPCAAYLLRDRCSEVIWDCQRGSNGEKAGMTKVAGIQNMVVEGELIRNKGLLDTAYGVKYLYPLDVDEEILICVCRNGSYHLDVAFLRSLLIDILPVVAEKRRQCLLRERAAERLLQESIYWNAVQNQDVEKGLGGALASLAKSMEADRVSILVRDGGGSLKTLFTYGARREEAAPVRSFPVGKGVAGWCVEQGHTANLADPRVDPRFISSEYDDIDSMLCCPLVPPEGEPSAR